VNAIMEEASIHFDDVFSRLTCFSVSWSVGLVSTRYISLTLDIRILSFIMTSFDCAGLPGPVGPPGWTQKGDKGDSGSAVSESVTFVSELGKRFLLVRLFDSNHISRLLLGAV